MADLVLFSEGNGMIQNFIEYKLSLTSNLLQGTWGPVDAFCPQVKVNPHAVAPVFGAVRLHSVSAPQV